MWLKYRVAGMTAGTVTVKRTVRRVSDDKLVLTTMGQQELGPMGTIVLHPLMGGMPVDLGWSSLRLFEEKVLPRLRP